MIYVAIHVRGRAQHVGWFRVGRRLPVWLPLRRAVNNSDPNRRRNKVFACHKSSLYPYNAMVQHRYTTDERLLSLSMRFSRLANIEPQTNNSSTSLQHRRLGVFTPLLYASEHTRLPHHLPRLEKPTCAREISSALGGAQPAVCQLPQRHPPSNSLVCSRVLSSLF